jgi:hypothetical protein
VGVIASHIQKEIVWLLFHPLGVAALNGCMWGFPGKISVPFAFVQTFGLGGYFRHPTDASVDLKEPSEK